MAHIGQTDDSENNDRQVAENDVRVQLPGSAYQTLCRPPRFCVLFLHPALRLLLYLDHRSHLRNSVT